MNRYIEFKIPVATEDSFVELVSLSNEGTCYTLAQTVLPSKLRLEIKTTEPKPIEIEMESSPDEQL